jgi:hypothetical protein
MVRCTANTGLGQVAGGAGDRGDGRPNFVGDGVKQRLAEVLGFRHQLGLLLGIAQPLPVEHERDLPDEGVEQVALVSRQRRGVAEAQAEHADRPFARH